MATPPILSACQRGQQTPPRGGKKLAARRSAERHPRRTHFRAKNQGPDHGPQAPFAGIPLTPRGIMNPSRHPDSLCHAGVRPAPFSFHQRSHPCKPVLVQVSLDESVCLGRDHGPGGPDNRGRDTQCTCRSSYPRFSPLGSVVIEKQRQDPAVCQF